MLPGYPDGSYGYAQVDRYLGPRLYIEYLGQGDRTRNERALAHLRSIEPHASKGPAGSYLTLQMGIGLTEWTIKWCEATERQLAAETEEG
jgi:Virulence activator alpha C-term